MTIAGRRSFALLVALVLLTTACGGAEDTAGEAGGESAATEEVAEPAPSPEGEEPAEADAAPAETEAAPAEDLGEVSFMVPVPTAFYMLPVLAADQGYFAQCGLSVNVEFVQPGPGSGALASGDIDFGVLPGPVVHNLNIEGSDLVFVGNYIHRPILSLVVAPEIESVEGLEGRPVAFGVPTSLGTIFMRRLLLDAGLDPDSDVQSRTIAGQGETLSALTSDQVQAAMLSVPQDLVAQQQGAEILRDLSESDFDWPFAGIVTRERYAQENPEQTRCLLEGIQTAIENWDSEEEAAKRVITERTQIEDEELLDASYEAVSRVIDPTLEPTVAENQAVLDELEAGGTDVSELSPEQFFTTEYLPDR